jgi:hypothetical protein
MRNIAILLADDYRILKRLTDNDFISQNVWFQIVVRLPNRINRRESSRCQP